MSLVVEQLQSVVLSVAEKDKTMFDALELDYIQPQEAGSEEADFFPDCYNYKKNLMLLLLKTYYGLHYDETCFGPQSYLLLHRLVLLMQGPVYGKPGKMVLVYAMDVVALNL